MSVLFRSPRIRTKYCKSTADAEKYVKYFSTTEYVRTHLIPTVVAAAILASPDTYSAAILGSPPEKYTQTILNPMSWGGAIELGILAAHYETEIDSVDVETGRVDQFTYEGGGGGGMRCILLYSGIHYDAVTLAPMLDAPAEWHQTVFPIVSFGHSIPDFCAHSCFCRRHQV